jgi:TPR repeat protein
MKTHTTIVFSAMLLALGACKTTAQDPPDRLYPSAKAGNPVALRQLTALAGPGKAKAQAVSWLRKAAEQGDVNAQHNLGVLYDIGEGVRKDAGQTVVWYKKAAEQGFAASQNNLGSMCQR